MKTLKNMIVFGLFAVVGILFTACVSLNPNTEGQILSAIQAKMGAFKVCYESALAKNRETKGTVGLALKIHQETGKVTSSSVDDSTIADNEMNQCVANAASDISLPEPPGMPVEGHYDINFDFE